MTLPKNVTVAMPLSAREGHLMMFARRQALAYQAAAEKDKVRARFWAGLARISFRKLQGC